MKCTFRYGGVEYSVDAIMEFTKEGMPAFWSEPFFYFYPDIDKDHYQSLSDAERRKFLVDYFTEFEKKNMALLDEKMKAYAAHWEKYEHQIVRALEDAFDLDLSELFQDLVCITTFSSVNPRYLQNHTFDNFYLQSEKGALGSAIHEIIHFVWFYVWHQHFGDNEEEYETPHLKWILSEMVVEPIMRDERLGSINPYFQHNSCAYPYFYTMQIDGKPILDLLDEMYRAMPITDFMEAGYRLCEEHEGEIRTHIAKNEEHIQEL